MKKNYSTLLILFILITASAQTNVEKWRFINIPDYHNAEGLSTEIDELRQQRIEEQKEGFVNMYKRHGGELITIPGDIVGGHWYREKFLKKFKSVPKFANYSTSEVVSEACKRSFEGLRQIIYDAGYKNLLVAVGDHEIGDNPWRKGSEVVKHIETFREGFANVFTLTKNGESRFNKNIGAAPPRPLGTIYEHTSNAIQYKNVLFVTIDMFRFDSKDTNLGDQGVVSGDISGQHLEWFESVLKEAQNIESIKHIIVQSHLPIIYPVRKYASSGMLVDKSESEKILNLLRKYNVDLYLAGEVHMNTVTKDSESDLIQFVGRGNNLSNLTTVDVEDEKLSLTTYHQNGKQLGSLIIDKSGTNTKIVGTDLLEPINAKGLQIHWSFDKKLKKSEYKNSIEGAFPKIGKHNPLLEGMSNPKVFLNDGGFNYDYSLISENVTLKKGIIDNAVELNASSKLFVLPIGPMDGDYERTISCWVKTTSSGRQLILNSGSYWGEAGQFFNLSLNEGNFELSVCPEIYTHTNKMKINNGQWHHLAVVLPNEGGKLENLKLFVDGELIEDKQSVNPKTKINTSQSNWMSIATQIPTYKTDVAQEMNMKNYEGLLDDFCIWTRALSDEDIKQLYLDGLKGLSAFVIENKIQKN